MATATATAAAAATATGMEKKIHFIWIHLDADKWVTDAVRLKPRHEANINAFRRLYSDWEVKVWRASDILTLLQDGLDGEAYSSLVFNLHRVCHGIVRCDIFRYLILYLEGGIYMDVDMAPRDGICQYFDVWVRLNVANLPIVSSTSNNLLYSPKGNRLFYDFVMDNLDRWLDKPFYIPLSSVWIVHTWGPRGLRRYLDERKIENMDYYFCYNGYYVEDQEDASWHSPIDAIGWTLFKAVRGVVGAAVSAIHPPRRRDYFKDDCAAEPIVHKLYLGFYPQQLHGMGSLYRTLRRAVDYFFEI